jgi:hypothetical protein
VPEGTLPVLVVELYDEERIATIAHSLAFGPTDFCMPIVILFFVLAVDIYYNCISLRE